MAPRSLAARARDLAVSIFGRAGERLGAVHGVFRCGGDLRAQLGRRAGVGAVSARDHLRLSRRDGVADHRRPEVRQARESPTGVLAARRKILAARLYLAVRHLRHAAVWLSERLVSHRGACPPRVGARRHRQHGDRHRGGGGLLCGRAAVGRQHHSLAQHSDGGTALGRRLRCPAARPHCPGDLGGGHLLAGENLECRDHDGLAPGARAGAGGTAARVAGPHRCAPQDAPQRAAAGDRREHDRNFPRARRHRSHRQHGHHLRVHDHCADAGSAHRAAAPAAPLAGIFRAGAQAAHSRVRGGRRPHGGLRIVSAALGAIGHPLGMETHCTMVVAGFHIPFTCAQVTTMLTLLDQGPLTRAESTGYSQTSTHADVLAFIEALRIRGDARLRVTDFGRTPEGRLLPLLILSNHGCFTPEDAVSAGLPVVLVQCGIHAGEVEGKEAALMLVRDLLGGRHGALLDRLTLLVAPLFNADGNDRIDPENRKLEIEHFRGQNGPLGAGTRENAAGINLNRDYMRQQGAEMRLMQSRVCHPWNPHLVIDCHTTNGSIHRFAMTFDIPHVPDSGRREPIDYMRRRLLPAVQAAVKAHDGLDSFWYGNFLRESLRHAASHGDEILGLLAGCVTPPAEVAVNYRLEAFDHAPADILTREPYTLSGAPIEVRVPYIGRFIGERPVTRPLAYAVPPRVARHLAGHGLTIDTPAGAALDAEIAVVRKRVVVGGRGILEADSSAHLDVEFTRQRRTLPDGWRLVRTAQQRGAIAVYLCEAGSDDGLLACELIDAPEAGAEFPAWRIHG